MKKKLVAVILLMTLLIITSACSPSTESAPAAPPITFISPANGQTVPLADLTLEVSPVEGAEGYAWTVSQYGAVLWDSFDSGQELTGPKYEIPTQSGLAQRAVAGTMTIQVRARVGGKWSETAEVAIIVSLPASAAIDSPVPLNTSQLAIQPTTADVTPAPTPGQPPSPTSNLPDCAAGWSHLRVGDEAVVMPGDPNLVRSEPQKTDNMIGKLYAGDRFTIIGGPECADGVVFWLVSSPSIPGSYGWTAEGDGKEYWLEPVK